MNITPEICEVRSSTARGMDVMWLLSDMLTSVYDVVSRSHRINITSTLERSDASLFHLLCKLDSLVFAKACPVLKKLKLTRKRPSSSQT